MSLKEKKLGVLTLIFNLIYIFWLAYHINTYHFLSWMLLISDASFITLLILYLVNYWDQIHVGASSKLPNGTLDIFLPVVNEPLSLFEDTVRFAINIRYDKKNLYILDDGHRDELKKLANKYDINYVPSNNNKDYKAGNLNNGLKYSDGDFILVLDADQQVVNPDIANDLLGYFANDDLLAFVTTKQQFKAPSNDFNHERLFYERILPGRNSANAAFSCGSGVIYRRVALEKIGGFQTWNLVEDLTTSYKFHIEGYRSLYVNKSYTIGLAPFDIPSIYKQRGTWALDTLRILIRMNPLIQKSLSLRQRLQYFETCWVYIVTSISIPVILITLPLTLFLETDFIEPSIMYPILRFPSFLLFYIFYYHQSKNTIINIKMWTALFPVYLKALLLSMLPFRPQYFVTSKITNTKIHLKDVLYVIPHIGFILFNLLAIIWYVYYLDVGYDLKSALCICWLILLIYLFYPIIQKSVKLS